MDDKLGRKCFVLACLLGIFCHGAVVASTLDKTINGRQNSTQAWEIDDSAGNKVTFEDGEGENKGSIAVVDGAEAVAARVEFGSAYTESQKQASLLTLEFANDASVSTALDDPSIPDSKIYAHIYAANTAANQSAVAIALAEGVNLKIEGTEETGETEGHEPVVVAHSSVSAGASAAIAIQATHTNNVTIPDHNSLSASTTSTSTSAFSGSTGIGASAGRVEGGGGVSAAQWQDSAGCWHSGAVLSRR